MQDLQSINRDPILDVIEDTSILKEKIEVDSLQADIWKNSSDDSDSHSKARYLGNQKKKKERIARSQSLRNILPIIMGNNPPPTPLRYVIHKHPYPNYDWEDNKDYDFEQFLINWTPLSGLIYNTGVLKLHQLIHVFVHGETWYLYQTQGK